MEVIEITRYVGTVFQTDPEKRSHGIKPILRLWRIIGVAIKYVIMILNTTT